MDSSVFCVHRIEYTISALSLYFWTDFNNSHTIFTRIVSRSHTFFQNKNPISVARTATIFTYVFSCFSIMSETRVAVLWPKLCS